MVTIQGFVSLRHWRKLPCTAPFRGSAFHTILAVLAHLLSLVFHLSTPATQPHGTYTGILLLFLCTATTEEHLVLDSVLERKKMVRQLLQCIPGRRSCAQQHRVTRAHHHILPDSEGFFAPLELKNNHTEQARGGPRCPKPFFVTISVLANVGHAFWWWKPT